MKIKMIYLAAGNSRRFGSNKLYCEIRESAVSGKEGRFAPEGASAVSGKEGRFAPEGASGKECPGRGRPMFQYGLDALEEVLEQEPDTCLTVVTEYPGIREYVLERKKRWGERILVAGSPQRERGISYSIRAGLAGPEADYYLFCVADQPWISEKTILRLIRKTVGGGYAGGYVCWGETGGNPAIFSRTLLPRLRALTGDQGGKKLLLGRDDVCLVQAESARELEDIDRPG